MPNTSRPLPRIDKDSEEYWASARAHALKLQRCGECERFRFYPGRACHHCGSLDFSWEPISGRGEVYTYSILRRARGNPFEELLPLIIVLVTLAEGPTMMANLFDCPEDTVRIGLPVQMSYEDVDESIALPVFVPA